MKPITSQLSVPVEHSYEHGRISPQPTPVFVFEHTLPDNDQPTKFTVAKSPYMKGLTPEHGVELVRFAQQLQDHLRLSVKQQELNERKEQLNRVLDKVLAPTARRERFS